MASITVKAPADFHVHLRQGEFSKLVTPHVRKGGFTLAYVMVGGASGVAIWCHLISLLLSQISNRLSRRPNKP